MISADIQTVLPEIVIALYAMGALLAAVYTSKDEVAPLLTFTKFFAWDQVWIASGILLAVGLFVSILASLITLRRYLKV